MHFMVGIIFAMAYTFFFINLIKKVSSNIFKGAIFGMAAFIENGECRTTSENGESSL
jgi:hypothetical protein